MAITNPFTFHCKFKHPLALPLMIQSSITNFYEIGRRKTGYLHGQMHRTCRHFVIFILILLTNSILSSTTLCVATQNYNGVKSTSGKPYRTLCVTKCEEQRTPPRQIRFANCGRGERRLVLGVPPFLSYYVMDSVLFLSPSEDA